MKYSFQNERIIIFGASRGLGAAVGSIIEASELLFISRKISKNQNLSSNVKAIDLDLSREADQEAALSAASNFSPTRIFYFVGGGPFGQFAEKNWRDHKWAFEVNFLFPAKLIHHFLKQTESQVKQMIFTGSAIAESNIDKNAASYSASKHALKALFENLQMESKNTDLRLFSPGYMNTDLLPKNAWPRELEKLLDPTEVADQFCAWALEPKAARHKIIN